MHKKSMIHLLSLFLSFSLFASGSMISPIAEQNEEDPTAETEIYEELPAEEEQTELIQPAEETNPEESPLAEEAVEEMSGEREPEEAVSSDEPEKTPELTPAEETHEAEEESSEETEPAEETEEEPAEAFSDDEEELYFYVAGTVVPYEGEGVLTIESELITSGTVSYDYESNTLTLDNAVIEDDPDETLIDSPETTIIKKSGEAGLTIRLAGSSSLEITTEKWNVYRLRGIDVSGPLTITSDDGSGSLDLSVTRSSNYYDSPAIQCPKVSIENCTLNVTASGNSFYIWRELHFGAGANVVAKSTNTIAINITNEGTRVTHAPIECDIYGYASVDDEEGTAFYEPEYVYDYYSWNPFERYHKVIVTARELAGNIVLSGNCGNEGGNVTFTLTDEGLLTITGTGAMADYSRDYYSNNYAPWYQPEITYVTSVVIGEGVTHIGDFAFYNNKLLREASLPSTVESIGRYAFCDGNLLTSLDLPASLKTIGEYAIAYSRNLEEVLMPEGIETIGEDAFAGCQSLKQITLPERLTTIGNYAFNYCTSLQSVNIPANAVSLGNGIFDYCSSLSGTITIPSGVTNLGYSFFYHCDNLEGVVLPDGLTSIGSSAFAYCGRLTEIDIPSTVNSIGEDAFAYSGLTSVSIPEGVTALNEGTFYRCTDLASAELPDSLTEIWREVFQGCSNLKSIDLPEGLTRIDADAFNSSGLEEIVIPDSVTYWEYRSFNGNPSLRKAVIGNGVTMIPDNAFNNCPSLTEVVIGSGVKSITTNAFKDCTALETIYIPDNVAILYGGIFNGCTSLKNIRLSPNIESLGDSVFNQCTSLEEIELPPALLALGSGVFYGCTGLTSLVIPETVTSLGDNAFKDCTNLEEIDMPASLGLYTLPASVFENCISLKEITIPDFVRAIGNYAFRNCTSLEKVHYNGTLRNYIYYESYAVGYSAFENCTSLTELSLTFKQKEGMIYPDAFKGIPEGLVQVYGIPGGTLESNASARNYTFHPVGFTVHYLPNGAEGVMEDQIIDYTDYTPETPADHFTPNAFTNGDLTFLGWNTKEDGSGTHYDDQAEITIDVPSSGVLSLYAQWAKSYDLWIGGNLIHSKNKNDISNNGYSSTPSTYDPDTNTLTLNSSFYIYNYNENLEGAGPERYCGLYYAGTRELTIIVKSYAEFRSSSYVTIPDVCDLYTAGPLKVVFSPQPNSYGTPQLNLPSTGSGTADKCSAYVGGDLTVSGSGTMTVRGSSSSEGHSYALRMAGGSLKVSGKANVSLTGGSSPSASYGLYLDGNTTLRTSGWDGYLEISGNTGAIGAPAGVTLNRRGTDPDMTCYEQTGFYGTPKVLTETSYPVSSLSAYRSIRALPVNHVMKVTLLEPDRNFIYTGSAVKPGVYVSCNGSTLYEGSDYTVKYKNNTKAWTLPEGAERDQEGFLELPAKTRKSAPQIIVTGKGNFSGSTTLYFEISRKSINPGDTADGTVSVTAADLTVVSGSKASPVLYYGTTKLSTKDFTVSPAASTKYTENTIMTVTGKGNYTGSVEVPVTVVAGKAELKNIAVDFGTLSYVYNGKDRKEEILSGITVYDALDKTEKKDIGQEHYSLTMSNNTTDAGTVKVTVTGINGYSGTKTANFKIVPNKDIDIYVYNGYESGVNYTGYPRTGFLSVYADVDTEGEDKYETRLTEGTDYKISYKNNTNVSTAKTKASYTISFIGSYKGRKAVTGKFDIKPVSIQNVNIVLLPEKIYTKPGAYATTPYVTYNGITLKQGKDYTVSYYRSVQSRYDYDLGRYVYEMSGPVSSKKGEMLTDEDFMTDGYPRDRVTVYAVFRGKGNFASDDPDLINYSAYQVRRQPETGRYLDMSKATVTITRKNEAGKTVKVTSFPYTGQYIYFDPYASGSPEYAADITVTYKYDKKTTLTLRSGTDYRISYFDNQKKGTGSVLITGYDNLRTFYDETGQPVKDMKGNEIGYIGFTGVKKASFKITAGKLADLLKKILFNS